MLRKNNKKIAKEFQLPFCGDNFKDCLISKETLQTKIHTKVLKIKNPEKNLPIKINVD